MTARRLCHGSVGHVHMTLGTWPLSDKCSGRPVQASARYAGQAREQTMLVDLAELAALAEGERFARPGRRAASHRSARRYCSLRRRTYP